LDILEDLNDSNYKWTSYKDAATAGYSNIMTYEEFDNRKKTDYPALQDYSDYKEYLHAMEDKYANK